MASQTYNQKNQKNLPIGVVSVPFPMQGHLNQTLLLSNLISSYGIQVHFAGSTTHNQQAKQRLHGWNQQNIHFHDLQLPNLNSSIPPLFNEKTTEFPSHLQPLFDASLNLRQPMFKLLQELSLKYRRIIVIHDTLMAYVVQDLKFIPNAESYALHSVSAFAIFFHIWDSLSDGKPFELDDDIPNCRDLLNEGCLTQEFKEFIALQYKALDFESGRLYNTCRLFEGRYMNLLEKLPTNANKKLFAMGPLNLVDINRTNPSKIRHECLEWLDKHDKNSVLFVSFGTSTSLTEEQITELAIGLERSDQKFLWVLRMADGAQFSAEDYMNKKNLLEGYESKVKHKGMVVTDWAPQLEILAHSAIGGFMSHCGWNSSIESISMGVPIIALPMHSDQPKNSIFLRDVLKICLLVRKWEKRDELVRWDVVENCVSRLMVSKEGEEMRRRANELGRKVRDSVEIGGTSYLERDSFITHISR
ncbi:zeatin O-glucosyltransferase-like [Amaranthus tricolor]|uniref:zeatin O-glucosyltransferase-like n=1 Tax=Amaranthus tricolor TaxID=29722 RepID=UPI0025828DE2|nr:zeatin O-glucosyltransferase-like [Amaranthus tricolor]